MTARLVQVTNVSTSVTKEQLKSLFTHLGRIDDIQLYPESDMVAQSYNAKVGYIRFANSDIAQAALNLTNTVFLDRSILVSIVQSASSTSTAQKSSATSILNRIPEEHDALRFCPPANPNLSLIPNGATWPYNIINRIVNTSNNAVSYIETLDPSLIERSLPPYPNLPGITEQVKAEEMRRTIYVSELDPRVTLLNLYDLFSQVGEIRYIKMSAGSTNETEYENLGLANLTGPIDVDCSTDSIAAFIEFSEQPSVVKALCLNGLSFANRTIKVNHSTMFISLPSEPKQIIALEDLRKESKEADKKTSSSRTHSSSSHRRHEEPRHRSRSRHKSSSHSRSSNQPTKPKTDTKKRDGSSGSTPATQSDEELPEENGNEPAQSGDENASNASSKPSPPPRKQARRSPSDSRTKRASSRSRHHHKSPSKPKRTSRSREREIRDKERDERKHHHHKTVSSSRHRDISPVKSKKEKSNGDDLVKSSKRSHSKSRKRSKTPDKSRKRSKSREKRKDKDKEKDKEKEKEKEKKSSRSERKRSKSKEKSSSSRHHHRHKSSSQKDDKSSKKSSKSESSHKSESKSKIESPEAAQNSNVKPRDYDQEERDAMDTTDNEVAQLEEPNPINGAQNSKVASDEESDCSASNASSHSSSKNGNNKGSDESEDKLTNGDKVNGDVNMLEK